MIADFHIHTCFSDGIYSPAEVLERVLAAGVTHFALTDHDTTAGIGEMVGLLEQHGGCGFLPGCELSCGGGGRIHMLLYGDVCNPEITRRLQAYESLKAKRVMKMVGLLAEKGLCLGSEALERLSHGNVGRAHLARELLAAGHVHSYKQAFELYLSENKSCYVPYERPPVVQMLDELRPYRVVPVLAHPFNIGLGGREAVLAFIESLIPHGLAGVEAYHPSANARQARLLDAFAREHGLLVSGGSDFHGDGVCHASPGDTGSPWLRMEADSAALLTAVEKRP